jgi:hypothetical protein
MLPGAICGETVKRKTFEHDLDDDNFYEDKKAANAPVKMKGKALRKLGDEDDY